MNFEQFAEGVAWAYKLVSAKGYNSRAENVDMPSHSEDYVAGIVYATRSINQSGDIPLFEEMSDEEQKEAIHQWQA